MFDRVKKILSDYMDESLDSISKDTTLMGDLELSSMDVVNLILCFEEEFDIEIDDDSIKELTTVGSIVDYLEKTLNN